MIHNLKIRVSFADDDEGQPTSHPLRRETFDITYVFSGLGLKPGYVVFGIKKRGTEPE